MLASADIMFAAVGGWEAINIKMQIAQTHGVFNILNTALHLPFVGLLAALVTKLIPDKAVEEDDEDDLGKPIHLETRLLNNPPMALSNAMHELLRMNDFAMQTLNYARKYLFERNEEDKVNAYRVGKAVDVLDLKITNYVIEATFNKDVGQAQSNKSYVILQSVGDIERIGDHAENILELTDSCIEGNVEFSDDAKESLRAMFGHVQQIVVDAMNALEMNDKELAKDVIGFDDMIDQMEACLRKGHIDRLNAGQCTGTAGAIYLDIINNLERIGDHCVNIAKYVLE